MNVKLYRTCMNHEAIKSKLGQTEYTWFCYSPDSAGQRSEPGVSTWVLNSSTAVHSQKLKSERDIMYKHRKKSSYITQSNTKVPRCLLELDQNDDHSTTKD